jgi:hypothetical protein
MTKIVGILFALVCCTVSLARNDKQVPDKPLDAGKQLAIIDSISKALNEFYIFPDVAENMETYIRTQYSDNAYQNITSTLTFADRLTEDLRSVSKDAHLKVEFHPDEYFITDESDASADEHSQDWYDDRAYENFGFTKVERLPGNVGYVQMRGFYEVDWAGPTAIAAMNFLAHCDAVIFDLRMTLGGWPSMIQLLASYFFDEPTQLSSFYIRKGNKEIQFWTQVYVSGPRMTDTRLYILTSRQTPSAAEAFAYDLKHLGRATIIGETTSGAAHPAEEQWFPNLNIAVSIPYGRAISPITSTNWEGTGVKPHIQVPAEDALDVAHLEALKSLLHENNNAKHKASLSWAIKGIEARLNPVMITPEEMAEYAGTYGKRRIFIKDGRLLYQREGRKEYLLVPMGHDLFRLEGMDVMRIQFMRDKANAISEMITESENGRVGSYQKE